MSFARYSSFGLPRQKNLTKISNFQIFNTSSYARGSMTVDIGSQSRVQYMLGIFIGYATQGMHDAITLITYAIINIYRAFYNYF